ncbi:hypothetical protein PAXRUDRAFT_541288 [Paxillus rubicundulus Ve08.2h10]|uniref:C2H2-type domain-containing protein n=1 Tax=Paxillus rubicundulus Ve08.2h10 TaxID=930991 RepID=A0A0D0E6T1_9AGAM|nr:hypothetical protein PAXRUDRAFT_541288 [Paxillus rubicundulus Ve08.2h10]
MVYCERCDRYYPYSYSYNQHLRDSPNHNICDDCDRDFATWHGLKEHYVQSPYHDYCQYCDSHFSDHDDLTAHYDDEHAYCSSCDEVFKNDFGLHEHNRQAHHYCTDCKRVFQSESNLRSHMNSSVHRPKSVPCPFRGCGQSFVSKSALVLHLESGSCRSGADRRMVDQYVREVDRNNMITDPSRLLTAGDDVTYTATRRSWNGREYECVLCHKTFRSLSDLNRHLASPRHQDKIYRCPLATCHTTFSTLSALCQHVESERCGVLRFKAAQEVMDGLLRHVGVITYG